jgi:hypothetical protein
VKKRNDGPLFKNRLLRQNDPQSALNALQKMIEARIGLAPFYRAINRIESLSAV